MRLRKLVLLSGTFALGIVFGAAGLAVFAVTSTQFGRDWVREAVVAQLRPKVQGTLFVGKLGGSLLGDVTLDSVEVRDKLDSVFLASGPIHVTFDVRDLMDRKIVLRSVELTRPYLRVKEHTDGEWNWRHIFPREKARPRLTPRGREFGDYVVIDSLQVHDGNVLVVQRWLPDDSLAGARRDSAIRAALADRNVEIRPDSEGYMRSLRWNGANLWTGRVRLAHPDSQGEQYTIRKIEVVETDPPFRLRNAHGLVRKNDDSVWIDLERFELPHTVGTGRGKIWWGSGLPMRWDLTLQSDSAGLADFAWIHPSIPDKGGGAVRVAIHNKRTNLRAMEYVLTGLDARSFRSRIQGAMTFVVGEPVLGLTNVALTLAPANFDLLRRFNEGPFPFDWQGDLRGTIKGAGGPINRLVVSEAQLTFNDANVPGAVSRLRGRGMLDILRPAFTTFRGFSVDADRVDLRTAQALNAEFPRLNGVVSGRLRLDSVWTDVRFSQAELTHEDGPGDSTAVTGRGRITLGKVDEKMRFDLDVAFAPLALTTLARSYPGIPIRGLVSGPMLIRGTADSLDVASSEGMRGVAGTIAFAGRVDAYAPRYAFTGRGTFEGLDLRALTSRELPSTSLFGAFVADVAGDSLGNLRGSVSADAGRGLVDASRLYAMRAAVTFSDGHLQVDTVRLESAAFTLSAGGGLGLVPGVSDTLHVVAQVDSLGGLRRYLNPPDTRLADPSLDSLAGTLAVEARLTGRPDSLAIAGAVDGRSILWQGNSARAINVRFGIGDATGRRRVSARVTVDTALYGALELSHAELFAVSRDTARTDLVLRALMRAGPTALVRGRTDRYADSTVYLLDSAVVTTSDNSWRLVRPARVLDAPAGLVLDTIAMRGARRGALLVAGRLPNVGDGVDLLVRGDAVPLADLAQLAQVTGAVRGDATLSTRITGTREAPVMAMTGELRGASIGPGQLGAVRVTGSYAARRLTAALELRRDTVLAMTAEVQLPIDLALVRRPSRLLGDSLRGRIRTVRADLSIAEAFTTAIDSSSGRLDADVQLGGTWHAPRLTGSATVTDGSARLSGLGRVVVEHVGADVRLRGDSIDIVRMDAQSVQTRIKGGRRTGTVHLTGGIGYRDAENPVLGLHLVASGFNIIDRPGVGDVDVSGELRLTGPFQSAELAGAITVDRGDIYIRELAQKRIVSLDNPDLYRASDSVLAATRRELPSTAADFVNSLTLRNVRIDMGNDVWLRSSEASINLDGSVQVARRRQLRGLDSTQAQFTLDGQLRVKRGTYRLNIGELVQRTFDVERGNIRFFASDAELNPALDISAIHTVRKFNSTLPGQDKRIRAKIGGTLQGPTIDFESADDARLSQSDLISYLVTGEPALGVGDPTNTASGAASTAANALITTVGSALGDKLASLGVLDVVQIQTAGIDRSTSNRDYGTQLLSNTRVGGGIQIGDRTYLSGNVGLCPLAQQQSSRALSITDYLGLKVEYRVNRTYSLSAGVEPSTSALLCSDRDVRGFASTPTQVGLDFTGVWRF